MHEYGRLIYLDIMKVLHKHTGMGEEQRLKQNKLISILEDEYGYENLYQRRKTVKRKMEELIKHDKGEGEKKILYNTKEGGGKKGGKLQKYIEYTDFGYEHDFTHAELRLIIDSIFFSKQIPNDQRKELIEKLERNLSSKHFNSRMKYISATPNNEPINNDLFFNIEILDEAINAGEQVTFQYNQYSVDKASNLVLSPRVDKDGIARDYVINPYQMVATNGRYYLICNNDHYDNVSHYRLDRITNIKKVNQARKPIGELKEFENEKRLDLQKHMQEHIYMFAGESVPVRLRFHKSVLSEFIDWFGTDNIDFTNHAEDEITVRVKVNREAMRRWALQYAIHVRVLSPKSLVDEIKEDIAKAWENYQ